MFINEINKNQASEPKKHIKIIIEVKLSSPTIENYVIETSKSKISPITHIRIRLFEYNTSRIKVNSGKKK